jgi:[ribosomal protein S5]-alanine N-acetyltransferase
VGRPYWGRGYATEAAREVMRYGFGALGLARIFATAMSRNPASIRVLEKIGMREEGVLRGHVTKWGRREDLAVLGMLDDDPEPG